MKAIHEVEGAALEWKRQHGEGREWVLVAGDEIVGRLAFPKSIGSLTVKEAAQAVGSLAIGETAEGAWSFKRVGFLNPGITVRVKDTETNLALFKPEGLFGNGVLEFADGRKFKWATDKPGSGAWTVSSADGTPLLRLGAETWTPNRAIQLSVEPDASALTELPILVLLSEYFLLMLHTQQLGLAVFSAVAVSPPYP